MSPVRLVGSTSGAVTLDCPAVGGNNTLVLPTGNGNAGNVLSTNGSGALSWAAPGKILQAVKAQSTGTTTTTSNADLAGLSASITISANSRVLIHATSGHYSNGMSSAWYGTGRLRLLTSGGTEVAVSEHQGIITANVEQCFQHTLVSLSDVQSAGTYSFKLNGTSTSGGSIQWNRSGGVMGWLILMEVAA